MRLLSYYYMVICPDLIWKHNIENIMELNKYKFKNLVISTSGANFLTDKNYSISAMAALEYITGQKGEIRYAKKSIAAFKLRKNMVIGCKVTLRGANGYRFLDTLLYIISPLSDRRKVAKFYPNNGSFNLSIENLLLFPELENKYLYFNFLKGINISINMENKYKQKPNYNTAAVRIYNTKKKTEAKTLESLMSGLQYPCN